MGRLAQLYSAKSMNTLLRHDQSIPLHLTPAELAGLLQHRAGSRAIVVYCRVGPYALPCRSLGVTI